MLLEIQDVRGGYGHGDIVKGVSCSADSGDILCLVGPNGCGKTTLFRLLLGSLPISGGSIRIDGRETKDLPPKAPDRDAAFAALEKVNALHLANEKYTALSGGQRQLILIARAICQSAKVFVMDEPAANLDYANHRLLMEVITDLAGKGYCVVMSTHSPEHPASIGSKVLLMKDGCVAGFGEPKDVITPENLEAVYDIGIMDGYMAGLYISDDNSDSFWNYYCTDILVFFFESSQYAGSIR